MKHICRFLPLLAVLGLLVINCAAYTEEPTPSPPLSKEEQLKDARLANQNAQAAYYTKLNKPPETKGFLANMRENPANVLGVFAALVAFISFVFNYRLTVRAQENTQFYETLLRFGNQDSTALRASSAAILAEMARTRPPHKFFPKVFFPWRKWKTEFFETALNQLAVGYLVEENEVGIISISDALTQLIKTSSKQTTKRLYWINERLIVDLVNVLTDYFIALDVTEPDNITDDQWKRASAASAMGIDPKTLRHVAARRAEVFTGAFTYKPSSFPVLTGEKEAEPVLTVEKKAEAVLIDEKKAEARKLAKDKLRLTSFRLLTAVKLFNEAFDQPTAKLSDLKSTSLFLVKASLAEKDLQGLNLISSYMHGADLHGADLHGAKLRGADLTEANLTEALLDDAGLDGATLDGAKMWNARINDKTDFSNCHWWKADFFDEHGRTVDVKLVKRLSEKYPLPYDAQDVHPSVRLVIKDSGTTKDKENNPPPTAAV